MHHKKNKNHIFLFQEILSELKEYTDPNPELQLICSFFSDRLSLRPTNRNHDGSCVSPSSSFHSFFVFRSCFLLLNQMEECFLTFSELSRYLNVGESEVILHFYLNNVFFMLVWQKEPLCSTLT